MRLPSIALAVLAALHGAGPAVPASGTPEEGAPGEGASAPAPAASPVGGPRAEAPAAKAPEAAAGGQVFLTVDEALELAFGEEAEVAKRTVYLTDEQKDAAEGLLGADLPRGVVRPYVASIDGEVVGVAWFDSHRVRTKRETMMFVVSPQGTLSRIEVLAFGEPIEYLPSGKWMAQMLGRGLDDELRPGRGVKRIAGATLSVRAAVDAARRSLAVHAVLFPAPEPVPTPPEGHGAR